MSKPLNADDELRKDIEHLILIWSSEMTGQPRERLAPDAITFVDRFSNFILADRKKHELQAKLETAEELLGITATWHSSDWTSLFRRRIAELKQELESYE